MISRQEIADFIVDRIMKTPYADPIALMDKGVHREHIKAGRPRGSVNQKVIHWSDCAIYRAPAYEPGPCDCAVENPYVWHSIADLIDR